MAENNESEYGTCECGAEIEPVWFIEEETMITHGMMYKTGRKRRAIDALVCPCCFKEYCVDDTFDGPWMSSEMFDTVEGIRNNH